MKLWELTNEQRDKILNVRGEKEIQKLAKELKVSERTLYYWQKKEIEDSNLTKYMALMTDLITKKKFTTLEDLSNTLNLSVAKTKEVIQMAKNNGYEFTFDMDGKISFSSNAEPTSGIKIPLELFYKNEISFGVVSDSHLNSKYARLDALNAMYDLFEKEGYHDVLHAGNIIDGYSKFNQFDVFNIGIEDQISYLIEHYPIREGITTHFITADDHEGWYVQSNGINIGRRIEDAALQAGRHDLHYIGHVETDIVVKNLPTTIRVMHPGGGTAYSLSYKPQKIIESFEGGTKPSFLIIGHYHKKEFSSIRNVPYVQAGCFESQTPFMRKNSIEAHVGGWMIKLNVSDNGAINRIQTEFIPFYNAEYYKEKRYEIIEQHSPSDWIYKW